jgi:D-alanine-D-alanine ligase
MSRSRAWWARIVRPKGHLSKHVLWLLALLAVAPVFMMLARIAALPGAVGSGGGALMESIRALGATLNENLSLTSVPAFERDRIVYLLFVPLCAVIVTLARLTFGIRVLGFRSILIAVGFHEAGVLPSLFLMTVVVGTIVAVRPFLKRMRLPLYARVSVILCIVAMTMLGAVLAGPWMRSDVLWGVVYFPVIVLGMLAEGIAKTLENDNMVTAAWRALTTILLAFLLSLVGQIPALRAILLQFPELVLTQVVAVVMIAEFLDLRLFQDWDAQVAGAVLPARITKDGSCRVAVVYNPPVIEPGGTATTPPRAKVPRSVQAVANALRAAGHTTRIVEGDSTLLRELNKFMPPDPKTGTAGGIVFNLASGVRGDARTAHVPALLEMAGIPFTGATAFGQALASDKVVARVLVREAGILTPAFGLMTDPQDEIPSLHYPMQVQPRWISNARPQVVHDRRQLERAVRKVVRNHRQDALVEEQVAGRRICVAVLGNDPVECLPLVEIVAGKRDKVCPAPTDDILAEWIREHAKAAFRACGCRDVARVDVRVGQLGNPYVVGVHTIGILKRSGSVVLAAERAGYPFDKLVCRIVDLTRARYLAAERARKQRERVVLRAVPSRGEIEVTKAATHTDAASSPPADASAPGPDVASSSRRRAAK